MEHNTVVLHDDALLPHWKEFANAMQLYQKPEAFLGFCIYNVQLSTSVIDLLTPALRDKPIKGFELGNVEFANAREGIAFAIEFIQSNRKLEEFGCVNSTIESMADTNHLVEAIISHPTIDKITLENCFGENVNAYDILFSLLASNKEFSWIDLRSNNIQTGGGTEIPDFLVTNPPLEILSMANNHLGDNDAVLIASALKRNTNLRNLHLGRNDITDVGRDALRSAVFDSRSLNAVSDSNHSCCIDGLDLSDISNNRRVDSPEVNRGRKIYSLLSSRNIVAMD